MVTFKSVKKVERFIFKEVIFNYRGKTYKMLCRYNKKTGVTLVDYCYISDVSGLSHVVCGKHYSTRILDVNFHIKRLIVEMKEGVIQV